MLEKIKSPEDIKGLSLRELRDLCGEIRESVIDVVSENGGHLASNLGMVETTVAIHRVFDAPRDAIIFDVGHQCYAHKMLTGRYGMISTIRKTGGLSGFTNCGESEYDTFTEGHSGTSISQALGLAAAKRLEGDDGYVVAVVGDGSFTNGMIYEALNNCPSLGRRLIIILNDNEMSISKNVGGLSRHLTRIRTSRKYFTAKHNLKKILSKVPWLGRHMISGARRVRDFVKKMLLSYNLFEALGVDYIGVANGNDLGKMINVLLEAKTKEICTVVHIHTKKGKGYPFAEADPGAYHSVAPFDRESGRPISPAGATFSKVFGETLSALARGDGKIAAVTAAMEDGTGLHSFKSEFPDRFFDVGIAEEHAVTFSAGLAKGGMKPVTALYSTFAQRTYDQLFHDFALQGLSGTVCLDRAGVVEGDGVTHQGIYDVAEFSPIPGAVIYSPDSFDELKACLALSLSDDRLDIIRYPKGGEEQYDRGRFEARDGYSVGVFGDDPRAVCVTYGRISAVAARAAELCPFGVKVIKLLRVSPIPEDALREIKGFGCALFLEEGVRRGGAGEALGAILAASAPGIKYRIHAIEGVVPHGSIPDLFETLGFTPERVASELSELSGGRDE